MIPPERDTARGTVLVTGSSGFLGSRTVAILSERGFTVHALVRKTSRTDHLQLPGVTVFRGDVADTDSMKPAFEGAEYVIHTAADTSGSAEDGKSSTIQGTMNVLSLCELHNIKKLVHISTCNVYGVADYEDNRVVDEDALLERFPENRGYYTYAKLAAETLVTDAIHKGKIPIVCLRPGTIYGPGGNIFTPMIGFSLGNRLFAVIGDGGFVLPLVYIDNLVEAIILAMESGNNTNKIYNVVDPVSVTKRGYMEGLVRKLYPDAHTIYFPFTILKMIVYLQENLLKVLGKKPFLTSYRLISSQRPVIYDSSKIMNELGWKPQVSPEAAFNKLISYERNMIK